MPTLSLKKKDLPFLLGGTGALTVDSGDLALHQPIKEGTPALLKVGFNADGDDKITLGQDRTLKIGISTKASFELTPVFSTSGAAAAKLLKTHGVGDFFKNGANSDRMVLSLVTGASADVAAATSFTYSALKTTVRLDTGADAGYSYLRAFDKNTPIEDLVLRFFATMRLPEQSPHAPEPGEAISLRYGGYLRLAAEVSAGYKLAGTKSFSIGELALSEKYALSILGKIGLTAGIAGEFSINVTGVDDLAGWARVRVHRHKSKNIGIAADVDVGFKQKLDGLPPTANEFLGAALGVNAKNFLNVFEKVRELSDFEKLKGAIDGLAKRYISEFVEKGFDELSARTPFDEFLGRVNQVVKSYEEVGDRAVELFDRYFDQLPDLTAFLDEIEALTDDGLVKLRKELNPQLWDMFSRLTDGDPLGFLLKQVTVGGMKLD